MQSPRAGRFWLIVIPGVTLMVMLFSLLLSPAGCSGGHERVVLYCAQDQEFAEKSLAEFQQRTGVKVDTTFDTEKDKSVSLYTALVKEKERPRCDVFWNNEPLNTIRLQKLGMLEPYDSPSAKPFPERWKAADHTWCAFAARARVLIVNTNLVKEEDRPTSLLDLTKERWKGRVVMAKLIYGTTATQGACLFSVLGSDKAKEYYLGLKANGVQIASGNRDVARWVGQGRRPTGQIAAIGITDTDDALEEIKDGSPVAMIFPDRDAAKDSKMDTVYPQFAWHHQGIAQFGRGTQTRRLSAQQRSRGAVGGIGQSSGAAQSGDQGAQAAAGNEEVGQCQEDGCRFRQGRRRLGRDV